MSKKTENNENDTFLSDWLAGKITDAQLRELVSAADFEAYQKLKNSLDSFAISGPDLVANYAAIKSKRIAQLDKKPAKVFRLYRYVAVAAMIAVLFGAYHFFFIPNWTRTDFGKMETVALNDNSSVTLNAKSEISYPKFFRFHRKLTLDGEAFFEVAKGSTFTVATAHGDVQVLGTKFNVVSNPKFFEVVCFEGRVKVSHLKDSKILTRGNAIRFYGEKAETWTESDSRPTWISGESSFRNLPLQSVINQLENKYHRKIVYPEKLSTVRFTGSFTHENLETALQSICIPMNLKYTITNSETIIISE